jgi:hypothetical protein
MLKQCVGSFYSREIDCTWKLVHTQSHLVLKRRTLPAVHLAALR